jgi:hypothetical protein
MIKKIRNMFVLCLLSLLPISVIADTWEIVIHEPQFDTHVM